MYPIFYSKLLYFGLNIFHFKFSSLSYTHRWNNYDFNYFQKFSLKKQIINMLIRLKVSVKNDNKRNNTK